ncbi:hypothetical protein PL1_2861 [Paenibacillus larvae subsp. larvae B-3650]|nr:hypothetical protein PL1_2861 [Paenibacillus larvae subsp. larvae B-3650]
MFKKGFTVVLSVALSATLVLPSYSAYAETGSIPTEQEKEQAKQVAENIEKVTGNDDIVQSNNKNAEYIVKNDAGTISIPHENDSQSIEIRGRTDSLKISLPKVDTKEAIQTSNGTIVYKGKEENSSVDLAVQPTTKGVRNLVRINDATAPKEYNFNIKIPEGSKLVSAADYLGADFDTKEVFIVDEKNQIQSIFTPAWAKDANGNDIPTHYEIRGNDLVQKVEFNENTAFPVVADPNWFQIAKCAGAITWFLGTNVFSVYKIIKIKKYMQELGGVFEAAELMLKASTWEERMKYGGKALVGLAAELSGVGALSVCWG